MSVATRRSARVITVDEVAESLRGYLGLTEHADDTKVFRDQIIAEYIRQSVYELTTDASNVQNCAYVTSITNNVRRQLCALWPRLARHRTRRPSQREQEAEADIDPDAVRRVMDALEDLRDIVHLGDGYWAPTPLRLIRLGQIALLIGGTPTHLVRRHTPAPIRLRWIARTAHVADLPDLLLVDRASWQSRESWLGDPPGDLATWTAALLADAQAHLRVAASGITEFEVYRPGEQRGRVQAFRWLPVRDLARAPNGLVLCRAFEGRSFGMRRYWLGTVTRTRAGIVAESEHGVASTDLRRLQYGLDLRERAPTSVRVATSGAGVDLTLVNPLPPEERRLVISIGHDVSPHMGSFPMRYRVDSLAYDDLRPFLERLGIQLVSG